MDTSLLTTIAVNTLMATGMISFILGVTGRTMTKKLVSTDLIGEPTTKKGYFILGVFATLLKGGILCIAAGGIIYVLTGGETIQIVL